MNREEFEVYLNKTFARPGTVKAMLEAYDEGFKASQNKEFTPSYGSIEEALEHAEEYTSGC